MLKILWRFLCWSIFGHAKGVESENLHDENYPLAPRLRLRASYKCSRCGEFLGWKA